MGIYRTLSDISTAIGNGTGDVLDNLSNETRKFACTLWSLYPDYITQNKAIGTSLARGYMNSLCKDRTLPPPPVPPYTGGQCLEAYTIFVRYDRVHPQDGRIPSQATIALNRLGKIVSITPSQSADKSILNTRLVWASGAQSGDFPINVAPPNTIDIATVKYVVQNQNNPADNCGNPEPKYPVTNPNPSTNFTTNITINSGDGSTLTIPVSYSPTNYTFPMYFDVGGIKLQFDFGGVNFNFGNNGGDGKPNNLPDGQPNPLPPPKDISPAPLFSEPKPKPDSSALDIKPYGSANSRVVSDLNGLLWVTLDVDVLPKNAKSQFGGNAQNVYYCGWFEYTINGRYLNRVPVHFRNNIFECPEGANGFAYTLYEGFSGSTSSHCIKTIKGV